MAKSDRIYEMFLNEEGIEIESIESFLKLAVSEKPILEYKGVRLGILEVVVRNSSQKFQGTGVGSLVMGRCEITCKLGCFIKGAYNEFECIVLAGKPRPTIRMASCLSNYFKKMPTMEWTAYE